MTNYLRSISLRHRKNLTPIRHVGRRKTIHVCPKSILIELDRKLIRGQRLERTQEMSTNLEERGWIPARTIVNSN